MRKKNTSLFLFSLRMGINYGGMKFLLVKVKIKKLLNLSKTKHTQQ
jgi:hypothetical protein